MCQAHLASPVHTAAVRHALCLCELSPPVSADEVLGKQPDLCPSRLVQQAAQHQERPAAVCQAHLDSPVHTVLFMQQLHHITASSSYIQVCRHRHAALAPEI